MTDTEALLNENNRDHISSSNPQEFASSQSLPWGNPTNSSSRINDTAWTTIFWASNAIVLISAVVNMASGSICGQNLLLNMCELSASAFTSLIFCVVISAMFGYAWIKLVSQERLTSNIVGLSFSLILALWSLVGLAESANGAWYPALLIVFLCTLFDLFYFFARHRLDFTYALLGYVTDCLKKSDYCFKTAIGAQLFMLLYVVIWLTAVSSTKSPLFFLFMFLNLIWAANVAIMFVYIISGNLLASTLSAVNPIFTSRSPECKLSFGSVCFGSLVLALVQTFRTLARWSLQSGAPGSCLALCIFGLLEYLGNFLVKCTFSYVAIWGIELGSAVERTSSLLRSRALDVFVNNNFSGSIVLALSTIGGIFGMLFGCLPYIILGGHSHMAIVISLSYAIGSFMTLLVATIVEGMIDSLMVLWIEAPDVITAYQSRLNQLATDPNVFPAGQTRLDRLISASKSLQVPFLNGEFMT